MTTPLGELEIVSHPHLSAPSLRHGFTTLRGAAGEAITRERDVPRMVRAVGFAQARTLSQVHGARVVRAEDTSDGAEADGVVTADDGVLLAVQTADCVPILLRDARTGAIGAVHAGWRGTAARIAAAALAEMGRAYGTRAEDVVAVIGPAIGPCCFEVGEEVLEALERATKGAGRSSGTTPRGRPRADLPRANRLQLEAAGVRAENVADVALCTHCRADLFPSFRREGQGCGRIYGFIGRMGN